MYRKQLYILCTQAVEKASKLKTMMSAASGVANIKQQLYIQTHTKLYETTYHGSHTVSQNSSHSHTRE